MHHLQQCQGSAISAAQLDAHCPLSSGGQAIVNTDLLRYTLREAQAKQTGTGQNNGVVLSLIQFAQPGIHIATQKPDLQIGSTRTQLTFPAQTGCTHHGCLRANLPECRNGC